MSELTELLPCPFCGSEAKLISHDINNNVGIIPAIRKAVCCLGEDCGMDTGYHMTEASAISAWNRRTQMTNPVDQPSELDARALESAQTRFVVTLGSKGRSYSPSEAVAEAITAYLAALPQPGMTRDEPDAFEAWWNGEGAKWKQREIGDYSMRKVLAWEGWWAAAKSLYDAQGAADHRASVPTSERVQEIIDMLIEARNQIEYLHGKFQETASGNAVMVRLDDLRHKLQP